MKIDFKIVDALKEFFGENGARNFISLLEEKIKMVYPDKFATKDDIALLKDDIALVKGDIALLKSDIALVKDDIAFLKGDIALVKDDVALLKSDILRLKGDISLFKAEVRGELAALKLEIANSYKSLLKWLIGMLVPLYIALVGFIITILIHIL